MFAIGAINELDGSRVIRRADSRRSVFAIATRKLMAQSFYLSSYLTQFPASAEVKVYPTAGAS
jgi:hypothetical protein